MGQRLPPSHRECPCVADIEPIGWQGCLPSDHLALQANAHHVLLHRVLDPDTF